MNNICLSVYFVITNSCDFLHNIVLLHIFRIPVLLLLMLLLLILDHEIHNLQMQAYELISKNIYFGICYTKTFNFHIGFLLVVLCL